jgi:hypothetical protein
VLAPLRARAQFSPYGSSLYSEGPGFRLGSAPLVLHPGAAVDIGYDTNVFYTPQATGSALLRLRAHFDLATLPPQVLAGNTGMPPKVEFRLSTFVDYREYLTDSSLVRAERSVNFFAAADVGINPRGPFTLRLNDVYVRTVDPRNIEIIPGNKVTTPLTFTRDTNRVGAIASYRPYGWGLEVGWANYFDLSLYEDKDFKIANTLQYHTQAYGRLRVLPQTLVQLQAESGYIEYSHNPSLEAVPFRVLLGATTLFTTWLGAAANVGYGNSFNLKLGSFSNAIGNAELRFFLPLMARLAVGYAADYYDTLFAAHYLDHHIYINYDQPVVRGVTAHLGGGAHFRHYSNLINPALVGATGYSSTTRDDLVYYVQTQVTYRPLSWMELGLSYNLLGDSTSFKFIAGTNQVGINFIKHSAFFKIDFAY